MKIPSRRKLGAAALIIAGLVAVALPFMLLHGSTPQGTSPNPGTTAGNHAKDATSSSISCSPSTLTMGGASTCTATVPDTTSASNTPTGTVSFTSSNPGVGTIASSCTLSNDKCTADFAPAATGTTTITGTYSGDSGHNGSAGSSDVAVVAHGGSGDGNGDGNGNGNGGGNPGSCSETKSSDPHPDNDPSPQANGNGEHNGNAYGVLKNKLDTTVALVKSMGTHDPAYHLHHDTDTDNEAAHGHHSSTSDPTGNDSSCAAGEEDHEQD
jgi:Bacterial Ig-like domain (group 3)